MTTKFLIVSVVSYLIVMYLMVGAYRAYKVIKNINHTAKTRKKLAYAKRLASQDTAFMKEIEEIERELNQIDSGVFLQPDSYAYQHTKTMQFFIFITLTFLWGPFLAGMKINALRKRRSSQ